MFCLLVLPCSVAFHLQPCGRSQPARLPLSNKAEMLERLPLREIWKPEAFDSKDRFADVVPRRSKSGSGRARQKGSDDPLVQ
jgi:hypothetical protein